jgi:hypothetical protein
VSDSQDVHTGAASVQCSAVQCSDQALVVPKATATYKHLCQEFKTFALEMFDRLKADACQRAGVSAW